jgi:hypothetical protein
MEMWAEEQNKHESVYLITLPLFSPLFYTGSIYTVEFPGVPFRTSAEVLYTWWCE